MQHQPRAKLDYETVFGAVCHDLGIAPRPVQGEHDAVAALRNLVSKSVVEGLLRGKRITRH